MQNVINTGKKMRRPTIQDIMELKKTAYDLVYLDPPYFSLKSDRQQNTPRRYHFLEGLGFVLEPCRDQSCDKNQKI